MASPVDQFSDWRWRLNNLYWITDKDGNRVKFQMNGPQEALFDGMHYRNVILKARQLGFSTFIDLFMLDACTFNPDIQAGIIAHTRDDAAEIFRTKVKYPYDNLPEGIRDANPATLDSAHHLSFANNSGLRVGTSLRSGTFQYLHVSEYGKLCAKFPEKAREVKTGAFNTVQAGQIIFVESTAEGQEGDFYQMCQTAQSLQRSGGKLTALDFKFHFFPWYQEPSYRLDPEGVTITQEMAAYFDTLPVQLDDAQKAWYAKKAEEQGDDMKREYPATPEEAFEASIEGAYYGDLIAKAETQGRITDVPHDPALPVETWWDLGMNDSMTIWFVQRYGPQKRVIDYYENSGEGLAHYASVLRDKEREGYVYNRHLAPHDGKVRELGTGVTRQAVMYDLGYQWTVLPVRNVADGIQAVRQLLPMCWFDKTRTSKGVSALRNYRKEWDDDRGVFKNHPLHNWASHGADAFRTGALVPDTYEDDHDWHDFGDDGRSAVGGY